MSYNTPEFLEKLARAREKEAVVQRVVDRWESLVNGHGKFGGYPEVEDFIQGYTEIDEVMEALKGWLSRDR